MKVFEKLQAPAYWKALFHKYKYVLLVCALGLALMLWPSGEKSAAAPSLSAEEETAEESVARLETRLRSILEQMDGVGRAQVLLTVKSGSESIYAYDKTESRSGEGAAETLSRQSQLVTVNGGGSQTPVTRRQESPVYLGAAVVCEGGGSPTVQLAVTRIVQSLTGIPSDHIVISKMKQ